MPDLGTLDGTRVIPPQVDDGTAVSCPACSRSMAVVKSHKRGSAFVSRHFRHLDPEERTEFSPKRRHGQTALTDLTIGQDCPGESDEHLKMKSIAFARLEFDFPDATVELESSVDNRIADVLVTFDDPREPYGNGIAVEVQYRNRGKDIESVTDHYLERGYSVAWLDEVDFSENVVRLACRSIRSSRCRQLMLVGRWGHRESPVRL